MPDETLSEKLALYNVALQSDRIPAEVLEAVKLHILDSIGCLLAGTRLAPGRLAYDMAMATGGATHAGSSLFGTAVQVSYPDAVQAMSIAAHCGEMDDIHGGAGICIGGMIVPALIFVLVNRGDSLYIPGGMKHNETATSSELEILEVSIPGEMGTVPVERPTAA